MTDAKCEKELGDMVKAELFSIRSKDFGISSRLRKELNGRRIVCTAIDNLLASGKCINDVSLWLYNFEHLARYTFDERWILAKRLADALKASPDITEIIEQNKESKAFLSAFVRTCRKYSFVIGEMSLRKEKEENQ